MPPNDPYRGVPSGSVGKDDRVKPREHRYRRERSTQSLQFCVQVPGGVAGGEDFYLVALGSARSKFISRRRVRVDFFHFFCSSVRSSSLSI